MADANGNLLGTTEAGGAYGGAYGDGTVFEIVKTAGGYASTPTTLVSFNGANEGYAPLAGLIADANGNLFGTTTSSGAGGSTVFEIVKTAGGYASTPITLVIFNPDTDGYPIYAGLIADADGNLFGTAVGGPTGTGNGTVFEIAKTAGGYASTPTTLVSFNGTNGSSPYAGLIADANGNLFGTTLLGGANGVGTVFEITGSGFVVTVTFAGTPGQPNCKGNSVSAFAQKYGDLNAAAAALGYSSVQVLQNDIAAYCAG